jgi:hypothetical protein
MRHLQLCRDRHGLRQWGRGVRPDQDSVVLIDGYLPGINKLILQIFEVGIIEVEVALKRSICHSLLALEECDDLYQDLVECHSYSPIYQ